MKILIIDNHTEHLHELLDSLRGNRLTVQKYRPGLKFDEAGKDLVVLSGGGGEGKEAHDMVAPGKLWYDDEIKFILGSRLPIYGICMGFELVAQAYGSKVKKLPREIEGFETIRLVRGSAIKQFESHDFGVSHVDESEFEILGRSPLGVEIIKHRRRPVIASQFHPEVPGGTMRLPDLLKSLLSLEKIV